MSKNKTQKIHNNPSSNLRTFNTSLLMLDCDQFDDFLSSFLDFLWSYKDLYDATLRKQINEQVITIEEGIVIYDSLLPIFIKKGKDFFKRFNFRDFMKLAMCVKDRDLRRTLMLLKNKLISFYDQDTVPKTFDLLEEMSQYVCLFQAIKDFNTNDFSGYSKPLDQQAKYISSLFDEFEKQVATNADVVETLYVEKRNRLLWISNFLIKLNNLFLGLENPDDYNQKYFVFDFEFWKEPELFYKDLLKSDNIERDIDAIENASKENNQSVFLIFFREMQMIKVVLLSYLERFDPKSELFLDTPQKQIDFDQKFYKILKVIKEKFFYFEDYAITEASTKVIPYYNIDLREKVIPYNGFSLVFKARVPLKAVDLIKLALDTSLNYLSSYGFDIRLFQQLNRLICSSKKYTFDFAEHSNTGGLFFRSTKSILMYSEMLSNDFYYASNNWKRLAFDANENDLKEADGRVLVYNRYYNSYFVLNQQVMRFSTVTLIHEFGHYFFDVVLNQNERDMWLNSGWTFDYAKNQYVKKLADYDYASQYACENVLEDFAETFLNMVTNPAKSKNDVYVQRFNDVMRSCENRGNILKNPSQRSGLSLLSDINECLNDYLGLSEFKIQEIFEFRGCEDMAVKDIETKIFGNFQFSNVSNEITVDFRPTFIVFSKCSFGRDGDTLSQKRELLELCVDLLLLSYIKFHGAEVFVDVLKAYDRHLDVTVDENIEVLSRVISDEMMTNKYNETNQKMFVNICRTLFDMFADIAFI